MPLLLMMKQYFLMLNALQATGQIKPDPDMEIL